MSKHDTFAHNILTLTGCRTKGGAMESWSDSGAQYPLQYSLVLWEHRVREALPSKARAGKDLFSEYLEGVPACMAFRSILPGKRV
jgi:hypothetical protein